ncbi:MAG: FAD-dependent monooxygenase [Hyphomicrobiales bacterium]|nr:FAD-dependent monooxygenase [Hyphomicrobiales bacterium]
MTVFDLVVAGAGPVGLALAAAVKQALGPGAAVALVDPARSEREKSPPLRTIAIAEGPRLFFERLGAWETIARQAQPILAMDIMDGRAQDAVRLPHLHFEARRQTALAHMVFNADVVAAVASLCDRLGVMRLAASVSGWRPGGRVAAVSLSDGRTLHARLAVAADGANSKLRKLADIPVFGWDYDQAGIVATVGHERDHKGRAEQHFLPAGPFAILPLPGRRSSIVWNESRADAGALIGLDPGELLRRLELRFTARLGEIRLASRVEAFPFRFQIARRFVGERLALVGDAAHLVHPLAGQGVNLGLRDAAALAETIVAEMRLGLDPGATEALGSYQRRRRFDIAASGMGMDVMNRLFSNELEPLRLLRDLGLRVVDSAPWLKELLIAEASGASSGAPRLLRGLAL